MSQVVDTTPTLKVYVNSQEFGLAVHDQVKTALKCQYKADKVFDLELQVKASLLLSHRVTDLKGVHFDLFVDVDF